MKEIKQLHKLIVKWKLSQQFIARQIGMAESTFKNKLNPNAKLYSFTPEEIKKVKKVLSKLADELKKASEIPG